MININTYITEKLIINKNSRDCHHLKKDDITYCVFVTGDDEIHWHPVDGFTSIEEVEEYIFKKFKDDNIRYFKTFDNSSDAAGYEINELSDLLKNEKNK